MIIIRHTYKAWGNPKHVNSIIASSGRVPRAAMGLTQNLGQAPCRVAVRVIQMLRMVWWTWHMRGLSHCNQSPKTKEMFMQRVEGPNEGSKMHWDTQFASVHANFRSRSCWNYVWLFGAWWKAIKTAYFGLCNMSLERKSANSGFSKDRFNIWF